MNSLLLLLLFPLIWIFIARKIWNTTITWKETGLQATIIVLVTLSVFAIGRYGQTTDTEIWNGKITGKERVEDYWEELYECNCTESCSGSGNNRSCHTTCQTCSRDHYTVEWFATTTVGNVVFDSLDSEWRSVYNTPDPKSFKNCKIGEPAALEKKYINYVKAVPESLFHDNSSVYELYAKSIPSYPSVYNFYKINRVLNVNSGIGQHTISALNENLNNHLKVIGHSKQANIIVILTNITDPNYRYAVENAWIGAKKNDIVVFVGVNGDKTITWVDIMTWAMNAGNENFHVLLRDSLLKLNTIEPKQFADSIANTIIRKYDRPQMKDYEYLKDEIDPPTWVIIVALLITILGSFGLTYFFHKKDI